jgi:hypothetical protein
VGGVVQHRLGGDDRRFETLREERPTRVQVAVPVREVAAGDGQAEGVAGRNADADRAERDHVLVDAVRLNERRRGNALAEAGADDARLRLVERPASSTAQRRAVQSVSGADDAANSVTEASPTSRRSRSSGAEV